MAKRFKVLLGYDGSKLAEKTIHDFATAGIPLDAEIKVACFGDIWIPPMDSLVPGGETWYNTATDWAKVNAVELRKKIEAMAKTTAAKVAKANPGFKVTHHTGLDQPTHGLLDLADKWRPDLLMIGSHGHGALTRFLLGSVSHRLMTHAPCSVRIVKSGSRSARKASRILVAIDGSKDSLKMVRTLALREWNKATRFRIATAIDFRLNLAAAFQEDKKKKSKLHDVDFHGDYFERVLEEAECILAERGLKVDTALLRGEPKQELLKEAQRFGAHEIAVGSRGLGAMERLFLGSVSLEIAQHASCTVEIVRG